MNILDKHPAPWTHDGGVVEDSSPCDSESGVVIPDTWGIPQEAMRLILSAPELLGSLQEICRKAEVHGSLSSQSVAILHARELVASIDSGDPAPKSKAEKDRDELLAALKALVTESASTEMVFADQRPAGWNPPALEAARALIARLEGGA